MKEIISSELAGIERFDPIEVTVSDIFREMHPSMVLPEFFMLGINGLPYQANFAKTIRNKLVVSQKAYDLLKRFRLTIAEVESRVKK